MNNTIRAGAVNMEVKPFKTETLSKTTFTAATSAAE
jgi:hypothetical protein